MIQNIKELPKCAVENCSNKGLVYLAGDFVCGECVMRYEKEKNKKLLNELKIMKIDEELKNVT